ncbi:MAG: NUDIX domain-containing protein [Candidatus Promineifilaceae bacterium]|nr:NUDIX domain-containing protein [Anaerolineaceae bacterium]
MSEIPYTTDWHGGVFPDMLAFSQDGTDFGAALSASLQAWSAAGLRFVWLEFSLENAALIAQAAAQGFAYHHINNGTLTMLRRLVAEAEGPPDASHYVGVGGIVINGRNQLLTIREKYFDDRPAFYKFPGGYVYPGEHLADAVVREVWEETAVRAKFHSIIGIRHAHVDRFGKSDLYFVCRLTPLTEEIRPQESEIAECVWMPVEQFLQHPQVSAFNQNFVELALQKSGLSATEFVDYPGPERRDKIELLLPSS